MPEAEPVSEPLSRTTSDVFKKRSTRKQLKFIVGVFSIIGATMGLTATLVGSETAGVANFAAGVLMGFAALFIGPAVGTIAGFIAGSRMREDVKETLITAALGGFLGFIAMFVLVVVIALPTTGSGSIDAGQIVILLLKAGIPTGIACGLAAYLGVGFRPGSPVRD